jgi:hypothetical protein
VARSRGIDRRSRDRGRAACRRAPVTLTPPFDEFAVCASRSSATSAFCSSRPIQCPFVEATRCSRYFFGQCVSNCPAPA